MHDVFVFEHEPFGMRVSVDGLVVLRVHREDDFVVELFEDSMNLLRGRSDYRDVENTLNIMYTRLTRKFNARNALSRTIRDRSVEVTSDLRDASVRIDELCKIVRNNASEPVLRRNAIFELNGWLRQMVLEPDAAVFTSIYSDSRPNVHLLDYNLYDVLYFAGVFYDYCHA